MKIKKSFNAFLGLFILFTSLFIASCNLDILEVHQPETAYANSKFVTTIRANFDAALGQYAYTLSILMPENWSIEGNQIPYHFGNVEGTYNFTYNSNNTALISSNQTAPAGYVWWSGVSENHNPSYTIAVAEVEFNTNDLVGNYSLNYHIGDTQVNNLSAYTSGSKFITVTEQALVNSLFDGRIFPNENSNPWDVHNFEVMYFSPSSSAPTTAQLILDNLAYNLTLQSGIPSNGKYSYQFDFLEKGQHEYYFLFDNTVRYPANTQTLTTNINDYDVYTLPLTETFEIDSPSWNDWDLNGDWEMTSPEGYNGDPSTAYEGDIAIGTRLVYNGFTSPNTVSTLKSPVIDARELNSVVLNFYHHSQINSASKLTIKVELLPSGIVLDKEIISNITTTSWEEKTINLSDLAAGSFFRVLFEFESDAVTCAGSTIDLVNFEVNAFYDAELIFNEETIVTDKGSSGEFLFSLENIGTDSDTYNFTLPISPEFSYELQESIDDINWSTISFSNISLAVNEVKELKLIVSIPSSTSVDYEEINLNLNSLNGVLQEHSLTTRVRPSILGSDNYGYAMYSSDYNNLAQYNWVETTTANLLSENDFLSATMLNLGFNFEYYGSSYNSLYLSPYGAVSFFNYSDYSQVTTIPANDGKDNIIGLYFTELALSYGGQAFYEQRSLDGQSAFVLTFVDCKTFSHREAGFTAQMILYEDGKIKFQYAQLPQEYENEYPIVGIEDYNGINGINFQAGYNALKENYALLFSAGFVSTNPQPENYSPALTNTALAWTTQGNFTNMKLYLREFDNNFQASNLIYNGSSIDYLSNDQIPQLNEASFYYWRIVGTTAEGYELASPCYEFYTVGTAQASGFVTDSFSHQGIEGVLVTIQSNGGGEEAFKNSRESILTDENGYWEMELMANSYYLGFSKEGYITRSGVYLDLSDDNSVDIEMRRLVAENESPQSNSTNIGVNTSLSWTNPQGFNYAQVEIATNEKMENALTVYQGPLTDFVNSISNLDYGTFYYWQVTLSQDGISNFSLGNVWRFLTEFSQSVPQADYEIQYPNFYMEKATKVSSGYVIAGGSTNNMESLMKVDNSGELLWQHTYPMSNSIFKKAFELDNGNFLVIRNEDTGYLYGEETGVSEVTAEGSVIWNQSYKYYRNSSYSNEDTDDGIIDSSGNIVICGSTGFGDWDFLLTKAAFNASNATWQKRYGIDGSQEKCNNIIEAADGAYILSGYRAGTSSSPIGNSRVLVMKVDSQGNQLWEYEEGFGSSSEGFSARALKAIEMPDASILIAGSLYDDTSLFEVNQSLLIKLSPQGEKLWHKTYPIKNYGRALDITLDDENNIYLAGAPDAMKLDSNGNIIWIYEDGNENIGSYFSNIIITEAGFTLIGGGRIAIFGQENSSLITPQNINISFTENQTTISWDSVPGASFYRIESSSSPNGPYSFEANSPTNNWSQTPSNDRKFFRIRAEN